RAAGPADVLCLDLLAAHREDHGGGRYPARRKPDRTKLGGTRSSGNGTAPCTSSPVSRPGALEDGSKIDPSRQRAERVPVIPGEPRGAERVGDGRRRMAHEQRSLQRKRERFDEPARPCFLRRREW